MNPLTIHFLGSGDAFGSGGRFQTCICVTTFRERFLLDCGASSLIAMRRDGIDPLSINAILLTHLHGDHFGGLPFFILDAQLISKRTAPLLIAGPIGTEARVMSAMEVFFPGASRIQQKFALEFIEIPERQMTTIGNLRVTTFPVVHASGATPYALRVECEGKVLAYSGDTEWTDSLLDAANGADLFICEAYYFEKKFKFHLDYKTLLDHRAALGCRRLVITHMNADLLARLPEIEIEYAEDGKQIIL